MKALFVAGWTLGLAVSLTACGEDYEEGGRRSTLPGSVTPVERDAAAEEEDPEPAEPEPDGGLFLD